MGNNLGRASDQIEPTEDRCVVVSRPAVSPTRDPLRSEEARAEYRLEKAAAKAVPPDVSKLMLGVDVDRDGLALTSAVEPNSHDFDSFFENGDPDRNLTGDDGQVVLAQRGTRVSCTQLCPDFLAINHPENDLLSEKAEARLRSVLARHGITGEKLEEIVASVNGDGVNAEFSRVGIDSDSMMGLHEHDGDVWAIRSSMEQRGYTEDKIGAAVADFMMREHGVGFDDSEEAHA